MFSSQNAVFEIQEVPSQWVFQYYLNLEEKLIGQDIRLKSVFNKNDKTPSMFVFYSNDHKEYRFKCFSTGKYGDKVNLVSYLEGIDMKNACIKILEDYKHHKDESFIGTHVPHEKWKVVSHEKRGWNTDDVAYWTPYNIGSKLLNHYNVIPLKSYVSAKDGSSFVKSGRRIYGYFTKEGLLYKIYCPEVPDHKFVMVDSSYLQGLDQIRNKETLFICSSLKDIMSVRSLAIQGDFLAPGGENCTIKQFSSIIPNYKKRYTIFDNDDPGIKAMYLYQERYGIPYIHLKLSKDISDSVRDYGADSVLELLNKYDL